MSLSPSDMLKMQRCEDTVRKEIAREQIQHPVAEYTEERVERLMEQMREAKRFQNPQEILFNV